MSVKELTPEDYEKIVEVWGQSGMHAKLKGRDGPDNLRRQMESGTVFVLGDYEAGRLRGVIVVSNDGRKGWMNRLAVIPEDRNQGIATGLVREAERLLRAKGIEIFAAHIEGVNESSQKLFEKLGYVPARDIIYYVKRLSDEV